MADTSRGRYWPLLVQDRAASAPSVSPDGSRMAYQSNLPQTDVIAVPLGEGPVRTVLGSFRNEMIADASPVAQQLVYVTDRRGVQEVWITSLAEGWDRPLFTPDKFEVDGAPAQLFMSPTFSPDGRRVVVAAKGTSRIFLYTAFVSGGAPVRLTPGGDSVEMAPTWSPDGNWIAFVHLLNNQLRLAKVRVGSGERPVDIAALNQNPIPAWSPTGEWIAAYDTNRKLMLVSPDGKTARTLPGDGGPFAWSRDGSKSCATSRDFNLTPHTTPVCTPRSRPMARASSTPSTGRGRRSGSWTACSGRSPGTRG